MKIRFPLRSITRSIVQLIRPNEVVSNKEEVQKNILSSIAVLMSFGGLVWGSLLVYFEIYYVALIPYGYILISALNISFISSRNLELARSIQIVASMLLPFSCQWMMGGYYSSGVVMLWSTLALIGSVTLLRGRYVYNWIIFFLLLTLFSLWLEPHLAGIKPAIITPKISLMLLVVNLVMISTIVFIISKLKSDNDQEINLKLAKVNSELGQHKQKLELLVKERTEQLENNLALMNDIQEDMKLAIIETQNANEAKSQFLANMSHEIRSPLNAILGLNQIMSIQASKVNLPQEYKEYIDSIKISGENLLELINNILDLSKIEAGKIQLSFETVNIKQLFKGIYQINKTKADEKDIHFTYEIGPQVPDLIETDRTKVNQILMNLVTNALKFTPAGKSVHLKLYIESNFIFFEVRDKGVGISADRIDRIFQPFEQADNSITRKFGGTGLGLTITKKVTEVLQGEISVKSIPDEGSTFTVKLPFISGISQDKSQNKSDSISNVKFKNHYKVLVVEDNEVNQQIINIFLKLLNVQTFIAENGKVGIEKIVTIRPDLVIMDIHMPVMDGNQAIQLIRKMPDFINTPIVCLTADAFSNQQKKALELGANDYLTKPIDMDKLVYSLSKYFEKVN